LQNQSKDKSRQFWLLRKYLRQSDIPNVLTLRVLRYLEFMSSQSNQRVDEASLVILHNLPENLMQELKCAVNYGPLLRGHPLFVHMCNNARQVVGKLSTSALATESYGEEEHVFRRAAISTKMFWTASGRLLYFKRGEHEARVRSGDWMCETCLWTTWLHRADLVVTSQCTLVSVDHKVFCDLCLDNFAVAQLMAEYAVLFVEWLNAVPKPCLTDMMEHKKSVNLADRFVNRALRVLQEKHEEQEGIVATGFASGPRRSISLAAAGLGLRRASLLRG